jgi:hypothetical protein
VLAQHFGTHTTRSEQSQSAILTDSRSQTPSAAPHHTTLNNRVLNIKQFCNPIILPGHKIYILEHAKIKELNGFTNNVKE